MVGNATGSSAPPTALTVTQAQNLLGISLGGSRIINGGMLIDQLNEGNSKTFTAGAALAWCVDQFYGYCTGANVTGQQIDGSGSNKKFYSFTGAASVTGIGFGTRLPSYNTFDLAGGEAVILVDTSSSLLTSMDYAIYYANSENTFGSLASPTRTLIQSGSITIASTTARYGIPVTLPAGATTGLEIVFSVGAQVSGNWFIGSVGFRSGTSIVGYDPRPKELELMLCKAFREKSFQQGTATAQNVGTNSGELQYTAQLAGANFNYGFTKFSTTKFNTPSLTFYNPAAANAQARDIIAAADCSALTAANISDGGFRVRATGAAGTAVGNVLGVHWLAESYIP